MTKRSGTVGGLQTRVEPPPRENGNGRKVFSLDRLQAIRVQLEGKARRWLWDGEGYGSRRLADQRANLLIRNLREVGCTTLLQRRTWQEGGEYYWAIRRKEGG